MKNKKFEIGEKYTPREFMELAVKEMRESIQDPDREIGDPNPQVGAVIATRTGVLVSASHRGELRIGDHAEYSAIERKNRQNKLDGYTIYATLEPCAPGARNHPKLSCAERIVNARFSKVFIGHIDPDPSVSGEGRDFLIANDIEVDYFDEDLMSVIHNENQVFFEKAEIKAHDYNPNPILPRPTILTGIVDEIQMTDLSEEALLELVGRMNLNYKIGSESLDNYLNKLGLISRSADPEIFQPTGLGYMLLGQFPQLVFQQSRLKFTIEIAKGEPRIKDIEGPILLMPRKLEEFLELVFLPEINRDGFYREEITDISMKLLRELIMNAIVHRDYLIQDRQVRIVASEDKIEIWSPGKPIIGLNKIREYKAPSISRNPKLAYIFYKTGLVEERGIGMKELKSFKENNDLADPNFKIEDDYFIVTIFRRKNVLTLDDLRAFVKENGRISSGDYARRFGVGVKTASRTLNKYVDEGILGREGEKKGTKYFFIEE